MLCFLFGLGPAPPKLGPVHSDPSCLTCPVDAVQCSTPPYTRWPLRFRIAPPVASSSLRYSLRDSLPIVRLDTFPSASLPLKSESLRWALNLPRYWSGSRSWFVLELLCPSSLRGWDWLFDLSVEPCSCRRAFR